MEAPTSRWVKVTTDATRGRALNRHELELRLQSIGESNVSGRNRWETNEGTKSWIFGIFSPWFEDHGVYPYVWRNYDGKIKIDEGYVTKFRDFGMEEGRLPDEGDFEGPPPSKGLNRLLGKTALFKN
ncbi:hypothetical protein AGMMS50296_2700 [Alphaproteobacteria bacterium]|nr:hypothetical protein AGMMS50296_2700 [Alphaproteobacteria bacterium]